jgi:hypothetical protein
VKPQDVFRGSLSLSEVDPCGHPRPLLDAGAAAKRAPAEDVRRQVKGFGRDRREIELLTCQHSLVDEGLSRGGSLKHLGSIQRCREDVT